MFRPEQFSREGLEETFELALIVAPRLARGKAISGETLPSFDPYKADVPQAEEPETHQEADAGEGAHFHL
jgi:hypothetical protein